MSARVLVEECKRRIKKQPKYYEQIQVSLYKMTDSEYS